MEVLAASPFTPTAWEDVELATCRVNLFFEDASQTANAVAALRDAGAAAGLTLRPTVGTLAAEEWSESWKRFFHTEKISPRIVVRPVWEPYHAAATEVVIDIDPGMSFGTGRHATTKSCLIFLDDIAAALPQASMLDMGCGSGILAIAAAKLGLHPVRGFDNDPDAVANAHENVQRNHAACELYVGELATCAERAAVVVANILAPVLIENATTIVAAVNTTAPHALVISGILADQYVAVLGAFQAHGFREERNLTMENWRSGWLVRA